MASIEQLEQRLKQLPTTSAERIEILNQLIYELASLDIKRTERYAEEVERLSRKLKSEKRKVHVSRNRGIILFMKSRPEEAEKLLLDALKWARELGDKESETLSLFFLGLIYWGFGDIERGYETTSESLRLAREHDFKTGEAWALNMLGGYFYDLGDYDRSQKYFEEARPIFEELGSLEGQARVLNGLANNYRQMGDFDKALEFQNRSLEIVQCCDLDQVRSRVLNDLAALFQDLGELHKAEKHYRASLRIRKSIEYTIGEITTLLDLGDLYIRKDKLDRALKHLEAGLQKAQQIKAKPKICRAHGSISKVYEKKGEVEKALEHHKKFHQLEEEVYHEAADKKLKRLQAAYQLEASQREAEIYRLRNVELKEKNEQLNELLEQLKSAQIQLIHSEKMASLGRLVAGITHEINSPIGAVHSTNDVTARLVQRLEKTIQKRHDGQDPNVNGEVQNSLTLLKQNTAIVTQAAERIKTVVDSLKKFTGLDAAQLRKTDLHECIESVLVLLTKEIGEHISVKKEYGDLPQIFCYPSQINQVFMSLLTNAVQSIESSGQVRICTFTKNEAVCVEISDTGRGIPKERLEHLFEFDFSVQRERVKLASGLVTAYNIIKSHKGEIEVASEVGKGSTFTISLPVDFRKASSVA